MTFPQALCLTSGTQVFTSTGVSVSRPAGGAVRKLQHGFALLLPSALPLPVLGLAVCVLYGAGSMTPEHELESEEDEAPEEVTFHNARSQAEESARMRREVAQREKAVLKEKRKRKQELFSEQKKKKLLSEDILQTVTAIPDNKDEPSKSSDKRDEKGNTEEPSGKDKRAKKLRPRKRLANNYKVVSLNDQSSIDSQQEKAKNFLQNSLYGKNKNRTTANEFLSIERKKAVKKLPSVQFTDQSWGEEEKKKAEKFNNLWRHKQKL